MFESSVQHFDNFLFVKCAIEIKWIGLETKITYSYLCFALPIFGHFPHAIAQDHHFTLLTPLLPLSWAAPSLLILLSAT